MVKEVDLTVESGSVVGLVTMEDVFETLLGLEIMDEQDAVADLQELARQKWKERAKRLGLLEKEVNPPEELAPDKEEDGSD